MSLNEISHAAAAGLIAAVCSEGVCVSEVRVKIIRVSVLFFFLLLFLFLFNSNNSSK